MTITRERFADPAKWQVCGGGDLCYAEPAGAWIWHISGAYDRALRNLKILLKTAKILTKQPFRDIIRK